MADGLEALKMAQGLKEADLRYDINGDGVVTADDAQGMMGNIVGLPSSVEDTGLYKEFTDQNKTLRDQFGNVTTQFGDLTRDLGHTIYKYSKQHRISARHPRQYYGRTV